MWHTHYQQTKSSFIRFCQMIWDTVMGLVDMVGYRHLSSSGSRLSDMDHENVGLRVQLLQLHQKYNFLSNQFRNTDEEGYMVLMQQQNLIEDLQTEKSQLSNQISTMFGTCQCGGAYETRAAAFLDYELKQCTYALDQCLSNLGTDNTNIYQKEKLVIIDEIYEEQDSNHLDHSDDSDNLDTNSQPSGTKPFDVDQGVCDFLKAVADNCIVELGPENCEDAFYNVEQNCVS